MKEAREKEHEAYMRTLTPEDIKRENLYTLRLPRPQPVLVRAVKDLFRPAKRRIERAFASGTRKS